MESQSQSSFDLFQFQSQNSATTGDPVPEVPVHSFIPPLQQQQHPPSVIRCPLLRPPQMPGYRPFDSQDPSQNATQDPSTDSASARSSMSSVINYKNLKESDCINLLTQSVDVILKDTYNTAFRQEIFDLLEVTRNKLADN